MKKIAAIIAIVLCVALNGCNKEDDMSKLDEGGKILYSLELKIVDKNGAEIIAQDGGIDKIKDLVSIEYKGKEYSPQELSTNPYVRPKMNPVFSIMPNEQSPRYLCFGLFFSAIHQEQRLVYHKVEGREQRRCRVNGIVRESGILCEWRY